jgi:hypothetical protein
MVVEGDVGLGGTVRGFNRERFLSTCGAFLRSGYPVLLSGKVVKGPKPTAPVPREDNHAICVTAFREPGAVMGGNGHKVRLHDDDIQYVYVHDDNLGPGVRCRVDVGAEKQQVILVPEAPKPRDGESKYPDPSLNHPCFQPGSMIVAVHDELRTTPDGLHMVGMRFADLLKKTIHENAPENQPLVEIWLQTRFIGVREYLSSELANRSLSPQVLGRVRFELTEVAEPMSLHLGLVQISTIEGPTLHVLYDTTESERAYRAFAHVAFNESFAELAQKVAQHPKIDLGEGIRAF